MKPIFIFTALILFSSFLHAAIVVEEIVARVGNEIITKSDYDREENRLYEELSHRLQGEELQKQFEEQKKYLLDFMINQKLLEQRAAELNLNVEEEVNAAVKKLREENNIPDDRALEAALQKEGSSLAELKEDFRRRIIQQRILWNYVQGKVNITEEEIKKYYEEHKSEFLTPPAARVRRYSITDTETSKEELKREADTVLTDLRAGKELKSGGTPHLNLDETTQYTREELDPRFLSALDAIQPGAFTDPIEISSGWLILYLEERLEAQPIPFEQARVRIYNKMLQERAEKYQKTFFEDLRKQSFVVIHHNPS